MPKGIGYKKGKKAAKTERTAADPNAKKRNNTVNSVNEEVVLPGTGSKYNKDGSKRNLGVNWK